MAYNPHKPKPEITVSKSELEGLQERFLNLMNMVEAERFTNSLRIAAIQAHGEELRKLGLRAVWWARFWRTVACVLALVIATYIAAKVW